MRGKKNEMRIINFHIIIGKQVKIKEISIIQYRGKKMSMMTVSNEKKDNYIT